MERPFIRVECDFCADGLWDERGAAYSLDQFPLSDGLKRRIAAWQRTFDEEAVPWEEPEMPDWQGHQAEGEAIARLVKAEMPDADVVAFDRRVNEDGSLGERVPYPGEHLLKG
ncbi:MAG TPA: hypothetical protein VM326_00785 [Sphingomicrobium sp.]|jgi:hypothetical protein|nr:hypothetical protein [Sphingomicrobium sp.]